MRVPKDARCRHKDAQQMTFIKLSEITGVPMSHPDKKMETTSIPIASNPDWEKIVDGAMIGPGRISDIYESEG